MKNIYHEDVPYTFQTNMRFPGKIEILKEIRKYENLFGMTSDEFHERFLEGDMKGKDARDFFNIIDIYNNIRR